MLNFWDVNSSAGTVCAMVVINLNAQYVVAHSTYLFRFSSPRKKSTVVMTMYGYEEYVGIIIEHLLRAVAMVNILDKKKSQLIR